MCLFLSTVPSLPCFFRGKPRGNPEARPFRLGSTIHLQPSRARFAGRLRESEAGAWPWTSAPSARGAWSPRRSATTRWAPLRSREAGGFLGRVSPPKGMMPREATVAVPARCFSCQAEAGGLKLGRSGEKLCPLGWTRNPENAPPN